MKIIFLLFIFLLLYFIAPAQCIVLNLQPGDCASCLAGVKELNAKRLGIPVYAAFPMKRLKDSSDLDFTFHLSEWKIPLVFSDEWGNICRAAKDGRSRFCLVNQFNKLTATSFLANINADSIAQLAVQMKERAVTNATCSFSRNLRFCYDFGLEKMTIYDSSERILSVIRGRDVNLKWIESELSGFQQKQFARYTGMIRSKIPMLHTGFKMYRLINDTTVRFLYEYNTTPDSISENIMSKHVLLDYNLHGVFKQALLLDHPDSFSIFDVSFLQDSNTAYCYLSTRHAVLDEKHPAPMLGKFNRAGSGFTFAGYVNDTLSELHLKRLGKNYLTTAGCSYPLVCNQFNNDVYNIKSGSHRNILEESAYREVLDKYLKAQDAFDNNADGTKPFEVFTVYRNHARNESEVYYRLHGDVFAMRYNDSGGKKIEKVPFPFSPVLWIKTSFSQDIIEIMCQDAGETRSFNIPKTLVLR